MGRIFSSMSTFDRIHELVHVLTLNDYIEPEDISNSEMSVLWLLLGQIQLYIYIWLALSFE